MYSPQLQILRAMLYCPLDEVAETPTTAANQHTTTNKKLQPHNLTTTTKNHNHTTQQHNTQGPQLNNTTNKQGLQPQQHQETTTAHQQSHSTTPNQQPHKPTPNHSQQHQETTTAPQQQQQCSTITAHNSTETHKDNIIPTQKHKNLQTHSTITHITP
ncbi:GATA zinc finger domain-containing protein 10-like [Macrobrachium nipponense]|uniref:GATA zinc finger domain-containing protein 10-like n=1 Tax=Macrobrachium nipponense TaxID=159736 RepID=UPI0030C88948